MTTKVGITALAALVIVLGGCGEKDGGGAPALQAGWPVPGPDARAQLELALETQGAVEIGDTKLHQARCLTWMTVHTAPGAEGLELVRTQGKVGGSIDFEEKGKPRETMPFPGGPELASLLFGRGGLPGGLARRRLDGTEELRLEAAAREDHVPGRAAPQGAAAAWALLGVVPPPPSDAKLVEGLTWRAAAAWPLFPACVQRARFEIEAVEAESIRVHATWLGADLQHGWTAPDADLVVDVSRRDGLALAATLDVTFASTEAAPDIDGVVSIPVKGTLERVAWTEPPGASLDAEAMAEGLADPDPVKRAKAAKQLGGAWPDAGRVATALVAALDDEDPRVRRAAADALRNLAERGVPSILAFLDDASDADREGYETAMAAVQMLGAKVTPKDLAGAGTASPPAGAVGLLSLHRFGASSASRQEAVWMLENMAASPAVLGPDGYQARNRELGAAAAAFVGLGMPSPDPDRGPPPGVIDRLASERLGTKVAAVSMLARWGGATPEVVEALRGRLEDEERFVAIGARYALERLGHPVEAAEGPSVDVLIAELDRIDADALRSHYADPGKILDALAAMGADAMPAVEAMEGFAKRARRASGHAYERAVAALVQVAGPTRKRRAALIERLGARLEEGHLDPWLTRPLLDALAVAGDRMDEDQAREIVGLLGGFADGTAFLGHAALRRLYFALDPRHRGALDAVWIERLEKMPPKTADVFPPEREARRRREIPGSERFHTVVRLGAKVQWALGLRLDLIEAAGGYAGEDERVRAALERLVAEGDAWSRTEAARALRRLDAR